MATEGTGAIHARGLGADGTGLGWRVSPSIQIAAGEKRLLGGCRGSGRYPAVLDCRLKCPLAKFDLAHSLGRSGAAVGRSPLGDFFACGWNRFA